MVLLIRDPMSYEMPAATKKWGGAGQTALPTSLSSPLYLVLFMARESFSRKDGEEQTFYAN
jgi:hypothetical protein